MFMRHYFHTNGILAKTAITAHVLRIKIQIQLDNKYSWQVYIGYDVNMWQLECINQKVCGRPSFRQTHTLFGNCVSFPNDHLRMVYDWITTPWFMIWDMNLSRSWSRGSVWIWVSLPVLKGNNFQPFLNGSASKNSIDCWPRMVQYAECGRIKYRVATSNSDDRIFNLGGSVQL